MNGSLRDALKRGKDCPSLEALIESVDSDSSSDVRRHAATCPGCQAELALYQGFEAPATAAERESVEFIVRKLRHQDLRTRRFSDRLRDLFRTPSLAGFALAAAVVVLSVGVIGQWQAGRVEPVSDSAPGVLRSRTVQLVTPVDDLDEIPREVRWEAVTGATAYDVMLTEVDRTVIFHKTFTENVLAVQPDLASLLVPGRKFFINIVARDASGRELAGSGHLQFKIKPERQER